MIFLRLISYLPLPVLYLFSDFLYFVSYYVVRYRRKLVFSNLKKSFPDKTEEQLRKIQKEFYQNLGDYVVEMLKLLTIKKEELQQRMTFKGMEVIENYKDQNQSILFLASHQFNWEWLMTTACIIFPMQIDFIYQPVRSKLFNDFSVACRTRFKGYPIKRDDVAREVVRRRHILRGIASVADQYPGMGRDKKYATLFLNQESVFFYGTNQLAVLTQYPVVFYHIKKIKRGKYEAWPEVIAKPPYSKDSNEVIEKYVRAVEKNIIESPSGWLWSHNRWKKRHLKQASSQYPHESAAS